MLHGYADSQWRRMEREGVGSTLSLLRIARTFQITVADLLEGIGQYPKVAAAAKKHKPVTGEPAVATWNENSAELKRKDGETSEQDAQHSPALGKRKFAK